MLDKRLIDRLIEVASEKGMPWSVSSHVTMDDIYQFYLDLYASIDDAEKSMFLMKDSDKDTERDECNTGSDITNLFLEEWFYDDT